MKQIFADSFYFFAVLNSRDSSIMKEAARDGCPKSVRTGSFWSLKEV